jgi:hypothetical protein
MFSPLIGDLCCLLFANVHGSKSFHLKWPNFLMDDTHLLTSDCKCTTASLIPSLSELGLAKKTYVSAPLTELLSRSPEPASLCNEPNERRPSAGRFQ